MLAPAKAARQSTIVHVIQLAVVVVFFSAWFALTGPACDQPAVLAAAGRGVRRARAARGRIGVLERRRRHGVFHRRRLRDRIGARRDRRLRRRPFARVDESLPAGALRDSVRDSDHVVFPAVRGDVRHRAGIEGRVRCALRVLPDRAQHDRGLRRHRPAVSARGARARRDARCRCCATYLHCPVRVAGGDLGLCGSGFSSRSASVLGGETLSSTFPGWGTRSRTKRICSRVRRCTPTS